MVWPCSIPFGVETYFPFCGLVSSTLDHVSSLALGVSGVVPQGLHPSLVRSSLDLGNQPNRWPISRRMLLRFYLPANAAPS